MLKNNNAEEVVWQNDALILKGFRSYSKMPFYTSIILLIFQDFNYTSQNKFIHLVNNQNLYKNQSTLWLPTVSKQIFTLSGISIIMNLVGIIQKTMRKVFMF